MSNSKLKSVQFSEADAKRQIRKLTVENRRLNREIDSLKNELDELHGKSGKRSRQNKYQSALKQHSDIEEMFSKKNYPSFIFSHLKHTSIFQIYRRIINVIRRYTFITTSLKIVSILFVFVETAALFVLSTSAFIASLLLTIIASHVLTALTFFTRKKHNKRNYELMSQKNVTIFFPTKSRAFEAESFFSSFVYGEAEKENHIVIIVSPYMFKSIGLNQSKKAYYISRMDGENIMLVRRNYYFTLKKNCIDAVASSVTEVY